MSFKKNVGDVDMKFNTEDTKPKPITTPTETFEKDGHVIYKRDETGFMQFFDTEKNPVEDSAVEKLADAYRDIPETSSNGDEKDGDLKVRYIKYEKQTPKNPTDPVTKNVEVDFKDCDVVEYRQYYKNGEAVIQTIPKKHFYIVKYLKGEYDKEEQELKEKAVAKEKEVVKKEEK